MNIDSIQSILRRVTNVPASKIGKALLFYLLSIEVERMKEADIAKPYGYPLYHRGNNLILIDLPCNKDFYEVFIANTTAQYPKDIYVGLKVKYGAKVYDLLSFTIDYSDIKEFRPLEELLPIPLEDFEVNQKAAVEMELTDAQISDINRGLHKGVTIEAVRGLLHKVVGAGANLVDGIYLALSSKALNLALLYSELNSKLWKPTAESSELLKGLLTNESIIAFPSLLISEDTMLRVGDLDESQAEAVLKALSNRVSVITGPPGTGKTQVILNIIANALACGMTALVASKNNMAVDNVRTRFDKLDSYGYLLRFGSKSQIATVSLPGLTSMATASEKLRKNGTSGEILISTYTKLVADMNAAKKNLARLAQLAGETYALEREISALATKIDDFKTQSEMQLLVLDAENDTFAPAQSIAVGSIDKVATELSELKNKINAQCSGFFGFWHRKFSIDGYNRQLATLVETLSLSVRGLTAFPRVTPQSCDKQLVDLCERILSMLVKLSSYLRRRASIVNTNERQLKILDKELGRKRSEQTRMALELEALKDSRAKAQQTLARGQDWIKTNSIALLVAYIEHYLANNISNGRYINDFKRHLESSKPWNDISFARDTKQVLRTLRLMSITSLSARNALPMSEGLFDILIIDEASQCDVASALPLIARAKQVVVIGDPKQLKHISAVSPDEETAIKEKLHIGDDLPLAYSKKSLYDLCYDYLVARGKLNEACCPLRHHYRCHPEIIEYSNRHFYADGFGGPLIIETNTNHLKGTPQGLFLVPVAGRQEDPDLNVNEREARECVRLLLDLMARNNAEVTFGIVTPFVAQSTRIFELLPETIDKGRVRVGTAHKFQGDEKDIMIYSPMVATGSPDRKIKWIDEIEPNLVNVAVTRARSALYVVCDEAYIRNNSREYRPLGKLISMCEKIYRL